MATGDVITKHVEEETANNASYKNEEEFTIVKRKRKVNAVENMEEEESCEAKRPNFPPLSVQSLTSVSLMSSSRLHNHTGFQGRSFLYPPGKPLAS